MAKGKTYDDLYLTDIERIIIDSYRNGARIDIHFHGEQTADEAIRKINQFGEVTDIWELTHTIAFRRDDNDRNLDITAYIDK